MFKCACVLSVALLEGVFSESYVVCSQVVCRGLDVTKVDDVSLVALSVEWACAFVPTFAGGLGGRFGVKYVSVVGRDDVGNIGHTTIADLYVISVEYFVQNNSVE